MRYTERRVTRRVQSIRVSMCVAVTSLAAACAEPTSFGGSSSSFAAEIRGARNETLTGSATASGGASWVRESAVSVTLPGAGTFSGIILASSDLKSTISMMRSGSELPAGTHRIGRIPNTTPAAPPMFTGGYVIRDGDRLQFFVADSGTVTIDETGQRVKGSFTLYASHYDVIKRPTRADVGQKITPIASGTAPVTISGTFDAGRR